MATSQAFQPEPPDSWTSSSAKVTKFNHMWTINNFSECREKTGQSMRSSQFSSGADDQNAWFLSLFPNGDNEESKDYISVYLNRASCNKTAVRAKFTFSILNEKRERTNDHGGTLAYEFISGEGSGYRKFILRNTIFDKAKKLLPDDSLTLLCEMQVYGVRVSHSGKFEEVKWNVFECQLENDFAKLFENKNLADVTLCTKYHKFPSHKTILAARSPVFAAMFSHEMAEQASNYVEIADIDHEVLTEMLRYIYTGKAEKLKELAGNLLSAADKYCLEGLKELGEEALYNNLSTENVVDTLIIADLHQADKLKALVIDFICRQAASVVKTSRWDTLTTTHPHLAIEALVPLATVGNPVLGLSLPGNQ